jgi:hypothetical protein
VSKGCDITVLLGALRRGVQAAGSAA